MTAIIYLKNKPFYCGNFNVNKICYYNEPILFTIINIENLALMIMQIKKVNYVYHLYCVYHASLKPKTNNKKIWEYYKKTPGNIKPIWVENDHGKQISFLLEG